MLDEMKRVRWGYRHSAQNLYPQKFKFTVLSPKTEYARLFDEYAFHTKSALMLELLLDNQHRDKLATATAKAICAYGGIKWVEPVAPTKPADGTIYRVQVGAFNVKENADNLKKRVRNKRLQALYSGGQK